MKLKYLKTEEEVEKIQDKIEILLHDKVNEAFDEVSSDTEYDVFRLGSLYLHVNNSESEPKIYHLDDFRLNSYVHFYWDFYFSEITNEEKYEPGIDPDLADFLGETILLGLNDVLTNLIKISSFEEGRRIFEDAKKEAMELARLRKEKADDLPF